MEFEDYKKKREEIDGKIEYWGGVYNSHQDGDQSVMLEHYPLEMEEIDALCEWWYDRKKDLIEEINVTEATYDLMDIMVDDSEKISFELAKSAKENGKGVLHQTIDGRH